MLFGFEILKSFIVAYMSVEFLIRLFDRIYMYVYLRSILRNIFLFYATIKCRYDIIILKIRFERDCFSSGQILLNFSILYGL